MGEVKGPKRQSLALKVKGLEGGSSTKDNNREMNPLLLLALLEVETTVHNPGKKWVVWV